MKHTDVSFRWCYLFLFHFVFGNFFKIIYNNNKKRFLRFSGGHVHLWSLISVTSWPPQLTASLCQPRRSLKDSLVPIDSSSLNILRHSAGTYVSSVIYWTGVCAEHMNDNQGLCASIEVQQLCSLWCCLRGRLGGAAGPSVSPRQSQRPSAFGPNPTGTLNPVTLSAKTIICIRDVWVFKCVYILSEGG